MLNLIFLFFLRVLAGGAAVAAGEGVATGLSAAGRVGAARVPAVNAAVSLAIWS